MYLPRLSYKLMHSQEGATGGKLMAISWLSSGRLSSNRPKHLAKHLLDFKLKVGRPSDSIVVQVVALGMICMMSASPS
jgi:hypothetical protein